MPNETPDSKAITDINDTTPRFQPETYDPTENKFGSAEIWWWDNGIWGQAGYAIPNDCGKPVSGNETVRGIHRFIGLELFNLMHRPDVLFSRPFNAEWLFDLNKMLTLGIKRLGDMTVGWTDDRKGDAVHAVNTPAAFIFYPVPFFGDRVRQADAKKWCGQILILLSEIMQHSDNEYSDDITDFLTSVVQKGLLRVQQDMAMKYLGMTRAQVEAPDFAVPATAFDKGVYNPENLFTTSEMIEERRPTLWIPSTNDLTPIKGIPANVANIWKKRWPEAPGFFGDGGAHESAFPGGGGGIVKTPGSK